MFVAGLFLDEQMEQLR